MVVGTIHTLDIVPAGYCALVRVSDRASVAAQPVEDCSDIGDGYIAVAVGVAVSD